MLSISRGDAADEVAGSLLVVLGKRQAMDVVIERPPEIVHEPLPDVGGEIRVQVGARPRRRQR